MSKYILIFLLLISVTVAAHPVGMKMKFSISESDSLYVNETTYFQEETVSKSFNNLTKKYISVRGVLNNLYHTAALIFAGNELYKLDLKIDESQYYFTMVQKKQRNRFIFTFSNTDNLDEKVLSVDSIFPNSFSYLLLPNPSRFLLVLDYLGKDILSNIHVGPGFHDILIKNNQGSLEFGLI